MRPIFILCMFLSTLLSASMQDIKLVRGIKLGYECNKTAEDKFFDDNYWAMGCPFPTKASLFNHLKNKPNYFLSLPSCNKPTSFPPNIPTNKLGITFLDEVPQGYDLIEDNTTKIDKFLYKGFDGNFSTVYTDIKNLRGSCHGMVAGFSWTVDEYNSYIIARYFTRKYKKTCFEPDTNFPDLASNEKEAFRFNKNEPKKHKECQDINGKVQTQRKKCKNENRCVIKKIDSCDMKGNLNIASFINQKNLSIHQDIDLLDAKMNLYHNSNYLKLKSYLANGWYIQNCVIYDKTDYTLQMAKLYLWTIVV